MYDPTQHALYAANSRAVAEAILIVQPRNGTDYSTPTHRWNREKIAPAVHCGIPALDLPDAR